MPRAAPAPRDTPRDTPPLPYTCPQVLKATAHNGFPVIENTSRGIFRGTILRNQLIILLREHKFDLQDPLEDPLEDPDHCPGSAVGGADGSAVGSLLGLDHFATSLQSKTLNIDSIKHVWQGLPDSATLDLRPYMNKAPIMVTGACPIARYDTFRNKKKKSRQGDLMNAECY